MEMEESNTSGLAKRIVELEAQCKWLKEDKIELKEEMVKAKGEGESIKGKYVRVKAEFAEMEEKFDSERTKWRVEEEKLWGKYWDLEEAYRKLQIDLMAAANRGRGGDVERLKRLLEESDGRMIVLLGKIEALDRQNDRIETDFKSKMAVEANQTKLEEVKNAELIKKLQALEREKGELMAGVSKLQKEMSDEAERRFSAEKALEAEKKRAEEVVAEKYELAKRMEACCKLQIDLKAAANRRNGSDEAVSKKMRASEAEVECLKCSLEERDSMITKLLGEIKALHRLNNRIEVDFKFKMAVEANKTKLEEGKNSELIKKLRALEREEEELVAGVSKLQKEKSAEVERRFGAEKALEAEKKRLEEVEAGNYKLAKWIEEEVSKTLKEKMTVEAEKRAIEEDCKKTVAMLMKKNEVLEKENKEMKKLCGANMKKDAKIRRILKEQVTLKAQGQRMILEKDEAINALYQENKTLEAQIKQLEMEKTRLVLKRKKDVKLAHQVQLVSNAVNILATPDAHTIQGNVKAEVCTPHSVVYARRRQSPNNSVTLDQSCKDKVFPLVT